MAKKKKLRLPRVSVPRPTRSHRVKTETPYRKRKHKKRDQVDAAKLGYDSATPYDLMIGRRTPNSF